MTEIPKYNQAIKSQQDLAFLAMIKRFASRMPPECSHLKKALYDVWEGEAMDYHIMKCTRCGMSEIWPVDHHTGKVLMNSTLSKPSNLFYQLIKFYKEAKE